MFSRTATAILLAVNFFIVLFSSPAAAEMRIFELQHRPAAELAGMVRQLVNDSAKVTSHRNTLMVNSTSAELAEVAKLVEAYDQPLLMLRITVEQGVRADTSATEFKASGRMQNESVSARFGTPSGKDYQLSFNDGGSSLALSGQAGQRIEKRSASQFIHVVEGYPASISVGHAVPFTSQLRYFCRRHPHFVESIEYKNVDTGFEVLPEVQGGMVNIEIRPYMNFLNSQNPNQIVFHEAATNVRVPLGRWFDLGSHVQSREGLGREIIGIASGSGSSANKIRIRIDSD